MWTGHHAIFRWWWYVDGCGALPCVLWLPSGWCVGRVARASARSSRHLSLMLLLWIQYAVYCGQWLEDRYSGRGTFTYPSGSLYVGFWKNGLSVCTLVPTTYLIGVCVIVSIMLAGFYLSTSAWLILPTPLCSARFVWRIWLVCEQPRRREWRCLEGRRGGGEKQPVLDSGLGDQWRCGTAMCHSWKSEAFCMMLKLLWWWETSSFTCEQY